MGGFIIYTIINAKQEIESKVEDLACRVSFGVKKISGKDYGCKEDQIEFVIENLSVH